MFFLPSEMSQPNFQMNFTNVDLWLPANSQIPTLTRHFSGGGGQTKVGKIPDFLKIILDEVFPNLPHKS